MKKKKRKDRGVSDANASNDSDKQVKVVATLFKRPSDQDINDFLTIHSVVIHCTVGEEPIIPVLSFDRLAIHPGLRSAFTNFKEPTPIQACTWPPALARRDVIGIAETGRQTETLTYRDHNANTSLNLAARHLPLVFRLLTN